MLKEIMTGKRTDEKLEKAHTMIGVIGLGLMGSRFLARLDAMGWETRGWNRTPGATPSLEEFGFQIDDTLVDTVGQSDILLSSLADDSAVKGVYLGEGGVFAHLRPQTIILEMSTISPGLSAILHREASKRGAHLIDLAVSGSTPAVETGTVTLFAGGDQETFIRCVPIFDSIARQWFLMGPATAGIRMKLVVNLLLGIGMEAIAEAVSLGEQLNLDRDLLLDVLPRTAVVAPAFLGKIPKIRSKDYSPQFPLRLMNKDLALAATGAIRAGAELPTAQATRKVFEQAAKEHADLDMSAIASYIQSLGEKRSSSQ